MAQNRGEWSELYALIYLLVNNDIIIFDDELAEITNNLFKVKKAFVEETEGEISFNIEENGAVSVFSNQEIKNKSLRQMPEAFCVHENRISP